MASIFSKIFNSKEETNRIIEEYGEETGKLFIKLWEQRSLRIYVTERTADFQAHLTNVLKNDLDRKIEQKYSTEVYMKFKEFMASVDSDKLYKECGMNHKVMQIMEEIYDSAAEKRIPVQQETYNWLLENYDI